MRLIRHLESLGTSHGIVRCTKEIELLCWVHVDGRGSWKLDICAYGQWWCERYDRKLDAYRMLRNRRGISWTFWRELGRDVRPIRGKANA